VLIVGEIGSGKSAMIDALIGELHLIKGERACFGRLMVVP